MSKHRQRSAQLFALIAMASFGMLFGTFLLSFLLAEARNAVWPPIGVQPINSVYAIFATGIIAASSLLYWNAETSLYAGNAKNARWSTLGAWLLAWAFIASQYVTLGGLWAQGQSLSSDIYSGSVHVLIGLHVIHLVGGLGGLTYVLAKLFFSPNTLSQTAAQIVGWFWHFLGALWVLIFLVMVL
ncbi:MAG TPA: hypothetical protein VM901_01275 [Bdellovibrionota bacterium]|nr:hypothetical protein [Bdellovibrionota bacterium]